MKDVQLFHTKKKPQINTMEQHQVLPVRLAKPVSLI